MNKSIGIGRGGFELALVLCVSCAFCCASRALLFRSAHLHMFEIFFVLSVALCWAPCALGGSVSGRVFDDTSGTVSIPIQ